MNASFKEYNNSKQHSADIYEAIKGFTDKINETLEKIRPALDRLPDQTRRVQDLLARRGWYLAGRVLPKEISLLDALVNDNEESALDQFMMNYGEEHFKDIMKDVYCSWPNRAGILKDAFSAHNNRVFSLSIPVMLAQADGMSFELFDVCFYSKKKDETKPKTAKDGLKPLTADVYKNKIGRQLINGSISDVFFLRPLECLYSIAISTITRDQARLKGEYFGPLNRHGILHGTDVDYACKANSLRVLLLLDYLTDLKQLYFKDQ